MKSWPLRVVQSAFIMHLKQVAVDSFVLFTVVIQPLIIALLAMYMLRDSDRFQAIYVIVGSALTGLWSGTLFFNTSTVETERFNGCLESIVGSPTHLGFVLLGKALANTCISLSSMFFSYPVASLVFGYRLTISHPLLFVISLLLAILGLMSIGLIIAPIMVWVIEGGIWTNALEFPMYILGGFLFPVILLPAWTTPLSYLLTPYWAARALHDTSSGGASMQEVFFSWSILLGLSILYLCLSGVLFRIVMKRVKDDGLLGLQ